MTNPSLLLSDKRYVEFARFLEHRLGIKLGDSKQYLVNSRLSQLMREFTVSDINTFISLAVSGSNPQLTERALESMTTNETFWFRDEYPYQILKNTLLPALAAKQDSIKIWSSACSYGQEPYSIAMVVKEFQRQHQGAFRGGVEILASDIAHKVLKVAQEGVYDELAISRGLPADMQSKYFTNVDSNRQKVKPELSQLIRFKRVNLLDSFYSLGKFDIIFCRNVLIYFDAEKKANILQKLSALLPSSGALLLGAAESISGAEDVLKMEKCSQGLYYSKR